MLDQASSFLFCLTELFCDMSDEFPITRKISKALFNFAWEVWVRFPDPDGLVTVQLEVIEKLVTELMQLAWYELRANGKFRIPGVLTLFLRYRRYKKGHTSKKGARYGKVTKASKGRYVVKAKIAEGLQSELMRHDRGIAASGLQPVDCS